MATKVILFACFHSIFYCSSLLTFFFYYYSHSSSWTCQTFSQIGPYRLHQCLSLSYHHHHLTHLSSSCPLMKWPWKQRFSCCCHLPFLWLIHIQVECFLRITYPRTWGLILSNPPLTMIVTSVLNLGGKLLKNFNEKSTSSTCCHNGLNSFTIKLSHLGNTLYILHGELGKLVLVNV